MQNIFFIGVDVDDKNFHGCGLNKVTGEIREFCCKPTAAHLATRLREFATDGTDVKVCYEATYLGFSLCRALLKQNIACEVIAPSLIPERKGKKVKTDRIDCQKLAEYYANGQLTVVHMPTADDELNRDLMRSRRLLHIQLKTLKLHIVSLCRRQGINYREEPGREKSAYWTQQHRAWLKNAVKKQENKALLFNATSLIGQVNALEEQIKLYDEEINNMAQREVYKERASALRCYRGIDTLTAMTFILELGDVNRFKHPKQVCGYAGMDLVEYSSGGHERRYHMTKMGNKHVRTAAIEAGQQARLKPQISKSLKMRRQGVRPEYAEIADRCINRLHKKSWRLLSRGKTTNKVKVACARELLCFVWESLKAAS